MATIITREVGTTAKGSPLTNAEIDNNFININNQITYNGPSIAPSLNLDFANSKTLDPRITFTRASTAAYYDGKTTVKAEENLFTYSQEFDNSAWTSYGASASANTVVAPDGTLTADTITQDGNGSSYKKQDVPTFKSATTYTFSVFVKPDTASHIFIGANTWDGVGSAMVEFSISSTPKLSRTRTIGLWAVDSTSVSEAANGFFRLSMVFTVGTPSAVYANRIHIGFGDGQSAIATDGQIAITTGVGNKFQLWGAQLEQRAFPTAYTPTTSSPITNYIPVLQTAASNAARIDHDPVTGECKGLLIEEQRTNLLSYSSDFDNVAWIKNAVSSQANISIAPDGSLTADKVVSDSTNARHFLYYPYSFSAQTYSYSVYVKYAGKQYVSISALGGSGAYAIVDTTTGAIYATSGLNSSSIQNVGNGWYRVAISWTASAGGNAVYVELLGSSVIQTWTGNGFDGVYVWGAQLEQGAFATSYIPTALTYSGRASTATYQGDDGFLATAAVNAPRYQRNAQGGKQLLLEGAGTNLLKASERFDDSSWSKSGGTITVIPNTDVAPDGSLSADTVVFSGASLAMPTAATASITGLTVTGSIYIKGTAGETIQIASGGVDQSFTLTGAWQRVSATKTAINDQFNINTFGGVTARTIKVWGAQLETGSVATSYMPSVDTFTSRSSTATYFDSTGVMRTAPANAPRYGYGYDASRAKWVSQGLLVEAQATNLYPKSAATNIFDGLMGSETSGQTDIAGTSLAIKHDATINTLTGYTFISGLTASTTYTYSAYVKNINASSVGFYADGGFNTSIAAAFGTSGSAITTTPSLSAIVTGASVQNCGNGWYRISITIVTDSDGGQFNPRFQTNGGSAIYCFPQLEAGSVATSYIPTTSAQVTRAADSATSVSGTRAADVYSSAQATRVADAASMTGTNFSSWYRTDEGTVYFDAQPVAFTDHAISQSMWCLNGANSSLQLRTVAGYSPNQITTILVANGANQVTGESISGGFLNAPVTALKSATAFKTGDFANVFNAGTVFSRTPSALQIADSLGIGCWSAGSNTFTGRIKKLSFYPKRLSNSELQALTA